MANAREALVVALARTGDRAAFEELVRRRQAWVRSLMRRCCRDTVLAEDLSQQVFLRAWRDIERLRDAKRFPGWLKQLAVNVWLQHVRKADVLRESEMLDERHDHSVETASKDIDLDRALQTLPHSQRLCVVLSYQAGMSHADFAKATQIPLGTVKSHVRRGVERLKVLLNAPHRESSEEQTL